MILPDIYNQIDNYYPRNIEFDDVKYKESSEHQNFVNLLITKVHNQLSEESILFVDFVNALNSHLNKKFTITTNNQFPAFFCTCLIEELEKGVMLESHRYLTVAVSLLTKSFCIHDYIVNKTLFKNKFFFNKILQIIHTKEDHSQNVQMCFDLMNQHYGDYKFYNQYFLITEIKDYYPPFDLKKKQKTLYHLLFGNDQNFQYSIPFK